MNKQFYIKLFDNTKNQKVLISEKNLNFPLNDLKVSQINNSFDLFLIQDSKGFWRLRFKENDNFLYKFSFETNILFKTIDQEDLDITSLGILLKTFLLDNMDFWKYLNFKLNTILKFLMFLDGNYSQTFIFKKIMSFMKEKFINDEKLKRELYDLNADFLISQDLENFNNLDIFTTINHFIEHGPTVYEGVSYLENIFPEMLIMKNKLNRSTPVLDSLIFSFFSELKNENFNNDILELTIPFILKGQNQFLNSNTQEKFQKFIDWKNEYSEKFKNDNFIKSKNLNLSFIEILDENFWNLEDNSEIVQLILKTDLKSILKEKMLLTDFQLLSNKTKFLIILFETIKGGENV